MFDKSSRIAIAVGCFGRGRRRRFGAGAITLKENYSIDKLIFEDIIVCDFVVYYFNPTK